VPKVTTEQMAADLRNLKIDLNDEVAVIRALQGLRYSAGDIVCCSAEATELAKRSKKNLASIVGDGLAMVAIGAVWLAWYCVLCPPVAS